MDKRTRKRHAEDDGLKLPSLTTIAKAIGSFHPLALHAETELLALPRLFRFLDSEAYANDLLRGKVWITTLERCRQAEGADRRDEEEGKFVHRINHMVGGSKDPAFVRAMHQTNAFRIGPGVEGITLENVTIEASLPDAYLLCFTERFAHETMKQGFGEWCIEITNPLEFYRRVTIQLAKRKYVQEATLGRVRYVGREFVDYEVAPAPPGLLKPPDGYSHQQEVRMLWVPRFRRDPLEPFLLDCPDVVQFCWLIRSPGRQTVRQRPDAMELPREALATDVDQAPV